MATATINLYEGLFLLNQPAAASDLAGCVRFLEEVLDRAEAERIVLYKWDEFRLAYPIAGQKRGTYMLAYFRARGSQIVNIERDCNLSDQVLRCMVMRADHIGDVELELAKKQAAEKSVEAALHSEGGDGDTEGAHKAGADRAAGPVSAQSVAVQVPRVQVVAEALPEKNPPNNERTTDAESQQSHADG